MTCTGWIALRSKYWVSSLGGLRPSRWPWCLRRGCRLRELANLPELALEGLSSDDACTLLESVLAGPLDRRVKDQIVAESGQSPGPVGVAARANAG